ncbi:MAG: hypothetical protein HS115_15595 [Spirochaetales bacterium]|nr:hypothetical protein [Spirochaetales bacterium]
MPSESRPGWMLDCREASQAISRAREETLSWNLWLKLRMHLLFCHACAGFNRFVSSSARVLRREQRELVMPEPMKESLVQKLKKE